jgi:hypothetical protein
VVLTYESAKRSRSFHCDYVFGRGGFEDVDSAKLGMDLWSAGLI